MKKLVFLALVAMGALLVQEKGTTQPKPDPRAGTWKLDAANSRLHGPPPKEETLTSQATGPDGKTVKYSISGTSSDGKPINESYDGKAGGKPYPLMADGKEVAKISYRKVSAHEYSSQGTATDGSTTSATVTLSGDGKTITVKEHVKEKTGEFDQVIVYNKQ